MSAASGADAPWPSAGRAWYAVGVLFIAVIFSFIDRIILSLLVDPIRADLGLTDTEMAFLLGVAFAVFFALFGLPIGRCADRYSRRTIIGVGIALWSLMTVACGLASNFWELFFARVGVAVGEAALAPAAFSMISDLFPREKLGRALGVYQSGAFIGAGAALLLGGVVIGMIRAEGAQVLPLVGAVEPWQIVFIVVGLPGLLVALLMATVEEPRRRVAPGAAAVMSLGEVLRYGLQRWRVYGLHFIGFAMLAVPITTTLTWAPAYFARVLGMPPPEVGVTLGLIVLVLSPLGVYTGGWVADTLQKRGQGDAMHRVGLTAAVLLVPICYVATTGSDRDFAVGAFVPLAFCASLALACAPAALQIVTPGPMRAQVSAAWMLFLNVITAIVGPTSVGIIADRVFGDPLAIGQSLALVNCASLPIAALALWLGRKPFAAEVRAIRT
ncbi:MAG: MFS transporter [Gammaproteobacteria bacterium]|nr:MFS transporter [Gammaproteobacteria bacterium]